MAIKSNLKSMAPRRQTFKREIKLLSNGYSAPASWPGGKITVYPWDSDVDAHLMAKAREGGGNILYSILDKVCSMNGASVDQFVFSEINAVMLVSRAIQYDGVVSYEEQCPTCKHTAKQTIKVPDELEPVGQKQEGYQGFDTITLPDCKDVVEIRPLLVGDYKNIEDGLKNKWSGMNERTLQIIVPVVTVNGGQPTGIIEVETWFKAISPKDARYLETQEQELTPHLNSKIQHKCDACGKIYFHNLTFDQEFFPARGGGVADPSLA